MPLTYISRAGIQIHVPNIAQISNYINIQAHRSYLPQGLSKKEAWCFKAQLVLQDLSVIAFASHCRVDQAGRPLAGLVNFCPFALMRSTLTEHFLYMVRVSFANVHSFVSPGVSDGNTNCMVEDQYCVDLNCFCLFFSFFFMSFSETFAVKASNNRP